MDAATQGLSHCLTADRPPLARRLDGLRRRLQAGKPVDRGLADLEQRIDRSIDRCRQRRRRLPVPRYPQELPVSARRADIAAVIERHQVVVVAGETGSGKTTQLPKICLEVGRGAAGLIGHTQPRRIAARSVAGRVAAELESEVGRAVGYQVRFQDHVGPDTLIKLMTDGILLAETQGDPDLNAYDTLIIDEAHERSLNIDFLLGYLKQLLPRRPDLKLIITSATIDTERFARHFDDAPVVEVSGRTYPVEVFYRPLQSADAETEDRDLLQGIVDAVDELSRIDRGDVLVFLSGEREIRDAAEALRKHHPPETEILPLFARLSVAEQNRIFQPHGRRRIVLATNVAETSLTVPGIRYVVDSGVARVSRYSHRSKVQRLPVEKVSRASADQRKGRCGRTGPGICVRLYSEQDYLARPEFTEPEIGRTNLAAVILRMLDLRLGDVQGFPFVDPPDRRYINDGYRLLQELGAVDGERRLTRAGRELARLPLDPRIGRMLLAARGLQCLDEVLVIASALTVQDPRERPLDAQEKADAAHVEFADERSDFIAYLNLWRSYHQEARHLSQNKLRRWCQARFLSYRRMREWHDLHQQLSNQVKDMGMRLNQVPADYGAVHQALLAGLLSNIGVRQEEREYLGTHGKRFMIFPGSALAKKRPKWIMAAELVETGRLYGRTVAAIEPRWVEQLAGHLVKRSHSEPHWEKRPAQVAAYERVSLYGIDLVSRRKVNYGPVNPQEARELFIRAALVDGQYQSRAGFLAHNQALVREIEAMEDKARRRDILVHEEALYGFYDARIPEGIYSGKGFEKWLAGIERDQPRLLYLERGDLMRRSPTGIGESLFPERLHLDGMALALHYRFEPGHADDGVTLEVPLAALNQLIPERMEWLVPGLLEEKITALIRGLPKNLRRNFVPAPDFAAACRQALNPGQGGLVDALGAQLRRMTGVEVPADAWAPDRLPDHLRMNFRVVDADGRPLDAGRDLAALQQRWAERARRSFAGLADPGFERDDVERWDFGELPPTREFARDGIGLVGYPALVVEGERIALRLLDDADKAEAAMVDGVCALFARQQRKEVAYLRRTLPGIEAMCMRYAPIGPCDGLQDDLVALTIRRALLRDGPAMRSAAEYEQRRERAGGDLVTVANELCAVAAAALEEYQGLAKRLKGRVQPAWLQALSDIREQLSALVFPGFVRQVPWYALQHYPRYLQAINRRLDKLEQNPARDRQLQQELGPWWQRWRECAGAGPELERYRWMLEEMRVSLFAQELRTAYPVSVKRLRDQWQRVNLHTALR
ncbi:MAG: ATP-dependent RNA helicase HrpA [Gammaproteobacteria bacterium]